jgi:hypothetical protein
MLCCAFSPVAQLVLPTSRLTCCAVLAPQVLCIQGFLAARKHSDRVVLLARMMVRSGFPCFKAKDRTIRDLEKRFLLNLTDAQVR